MKREREDSLLVLVETAKKRKSKRVKVVAQKLITFYYLLTKKT